MDLIADSRSAWPGRNLRANAFRIIVREMGNGVDRVDGVVFVPLADAEAGARADDAHRLPFPLSRRFFDLVMVAGMPADDLARPLLGGYARPLADGRLEVTAWDAGTG